MARLRTIGDAASAIFASASALVIVALMLVTVADVVQRALTGKSIEGAVEVSPLILVVAVLLGVPGAERSRTHVRTSLVTGRMPPRPRALVRALGYTVVIALLVWMVWVTAQRAREAIEFHDATPGFVGLPEWPARVAIPIGLAFFAIELLVRLWGEILVLTRRRRPEPANADAEPPTAVASGQGVV